MNSMDNVRIEESFERLLGYCEKEGFKGYDPYDGLNSKLFKSIPFFSNNRYVKLAWIQFFKRSPVNFRRLVGVEKEFNPKAIGLFLSSYCILYKMDKKPEHLKRVNELASLALDLRTKGWSGSCWGYNFDWQARAFFQPKGTPTVVATTFVANALLDAFEITNDRRLLDAARSACDFVLCDLNRTPDESGRGFCFSYSPLDTSVVYNASLLGARLLSRVYSHTNEDTLIQEARSAVLFVCERQLSNGSWPYGAYDFHQWIDNFHTGYNLECIADFQRFSGSHEFDGVLRKGFEFYIETFFSDEGIPRYYSHQTYPIDVHTTSQLMVTVAKSGNFARYGQTCKNVLLWTIAHMQSKKEGRFFYQINRFFTSRISYMRWSQAWMVYGMSVYLQEVWKINQECSDR